ncbi:hypothetical protein [Pseudomarimonas salicorniae]|uniref:Beta-barrel assembly machine subunit BamC n=1 Tax=Pseudomarimonas salicorniae TaxID=2933270 RepID=A0ABT0GLL9_9GAMM|nr:hypothetical protein [Lysobacter sp. CAU 1642]MCK7595445.1 hypothetical protein [Lysobacter sp. CAU 1642]
MSMYPVVKSGLRLAVLACLVASVAGCSWFRGKSGYELAPESRPLAIPPDLDTPPQDPTLSIPEPSGVAPRAPVAPSAAFTVADSRDSALRRLGLALERLEGVEVTGSAQALGAYNVRFEGEDFLVRVVESGGSTRIEAVGANGAVINTGPAGKLLGLLRQRLG